MPAFGTCQKPFGVDDRMLCDRETLLALKRTARLSRPCPASPASSHIHTAHLPRLDARDVIVGSRHACSWSGLIASSLISRHDCRGCPEDHPTRARVDGQNTVFLTHSSSYLSLISIEAWGCTLRESEPIRLGT